MRHASHSPDIGWLNSRHAMASPLAAILITGAFASPVLSQENIPATPTVAGISPQPKLTTPKVTRTPEFDGKEGVELTSKHGFFISIASPDDELVKVAMPNAQPDDKTVAVGVRRAGRKVISICAHVSKWELDKFNHALLPEEADNPCTPEAINTLKNRYTFGVNFNGLNKIDGVLTPVNNAADCDPTFYRYYGPASDVAYGSDPDAKNVFEIPVILDDRTKVQVKNFVYYRRQSRDKKAAYVRLSEEYIDGATVEEVEKMSLWGVVDSDCADPASGGQEKPEDAVRGHRPKSGRK